MANNFLDTLFNQGKLPDVNVQVQIDNETIIRLAGAILVVMFISILLNRAITKHSN